MNIEPLEARIAPAILVWDGSAGRSWSTPANWNLNQAPADGDTLVFPQNAQNKENNNNIEGLDLKSVRIEGANYFLDGRDITVSDTFFANIPAPAIDERRGEFEIDVTFVGTAPRIISNGVSTMDFEDNEVTLDNVTLTIGGTGNVAIDRLEGTGTLIKTGTGQVTIENNLSGFSGPGNVSGGTFRISGAFEGPLTVTAGGTLQPAGFNQVGNVSIAGGTLLLDATLDSGEITFTPESTIVAVLNGNFGGNLEAAGNVSLGGAALSVRLESPSENGDTFDIIASNVGVTGTFAGLPDNQTFLVDGRMFRIDYTAGSVILTDITPTFVWDGGGVDNSWLNPANWAGDVAPSPGSDLVFPAGAPADSLAMINNFGPGTPFAGLTFSGAGYSVVGNSIGLGRNGISATGDTEFAPGITLTTSSRLSVNVAELTILGTLDVGSNELAISNGNTGAFFLGPVNGTGDIRKSGPASIEIAAGGTFSGIFHLLDGELIDFGSLEAADLVLDGASPRVRTAPGGSTFASLTTFGGTVDLGSSDGQLNVLGPVLLSGTSTRATELEVQLKATTHDQLIVKGAVELAKATLTILPAFSPADGREFLIIDNDGTDKVKGTFLDLPEGRAFAVGNQFFQISYRGGDGNDVTIAAVVPGVELSPNGRKATYRDIDGDRVTVTTSVGNLQNAAFTFDPIVSPFGGFQLQIVKLGSSFAGANISITAVKAPTGDGRVNVGFIDAGGADLGKVNVAGDLSRISAGDSDETTTGLAGLKVRSLGVFGTATLGPLALASQITGPCGPITVAGDVVDVEFRVTGSTPANGRIASLAIGGSFIGGSEVNAGFFRATGNIGSITIARDILGGSGTDSGKIVAFGDIGSLRVGGTLFGGSGTYDATAGNEGQILALGTLRTVTIGGDVIGGEGGFSAAIRGIVGLGPVSIGGSVLGGDGISSARLESGGAAGAIKIRHDIVGGDGASSARLVVAENLARITVGGSVLAGEGVSSANMNINNAIGGLSGAIRIGGDVRGLAAEGALIFSRNGSIASVTIGGSLLGGTGLFAGGVIALEKIGPVIVRGDILGEGSQPVLIRAGGLLTLPVGSATNVALTSLTVAGDVANLKVLGGFGVNNTPINGRIQIGGGIL